MAYEALRQICAKFSSLPELWKVNVAHLDFLLRGKRLHTALALVEGLIVGKEIFCQAAACVCNSQCMLIIFIAFLKILKNPEGGSRNATVVVVLAVISC